MTIHVVRSGETLNAIAAQYGVNPAQLGAANDVPAGGALAVGQTLVVRFPRQVHAVRPGETLSSIAAAYGTDTRTLWQNNWSLSGGDALTAGQLVKISYFDEKIGAAAFNGYAYPFIDPRLLEAQLPYLTYMAPFTYGINAQGGLLPLDDGAMLSSARTHGTRPVMHLSTLTESGGFDTERGAMVLTDYAVQERLISEIFETIQDRGYVGLDVDFEYLPGYLAAAYAAFLDRLHRMLRARGLFLWAALAPKTSSTQQGLLYEAHDYAAVSAAVDGVLLMTYGCCTWYTVFHILFGFAEFCRKTPDISGIFRERVYELQITPQISPQCVPTAALIVSSSTFLAKSRSFSRSGENLK